MLNMTTQESKICSFTAKGMRLQLLKVSYNGTFNYLYEIRENRKKIAEKSNLIKAMYIFNDIQQKFVWQNILNKTLKLDL